MQLAGELSPARVSDSAGESAIGQHPRGVQIFDDEPVVGLDQLVGDPVEEMLANVRSAVVMPGQLAGSVAAVM
ncbi:hypothetical protein ABW16_14505 [Mycolicibacter heraklionensis]|uniref:Uncharacterized protein n=1 Tax=Mycolicibacter heraklionensis TaxID=512402 RepID=A0ABR5FDD6_9MYCO|nr:hypothetical protein ABW16_14505 [Mycolicibacter heraklionensis]